MGAAPAGCNLGPGELPMSAARKLPRMGVMAHHWSIQREVSPGVFVVLGEYGGNGSGASHRAAASQLSKFPGAVLVAPPAPVPPTSGGI